MRLNYTDSAPPRGWLWFLSPVLVLIEKIIPGGPGGGAPPGLSMILKEMGLYTVLPLTGRNEESSGHVKKWTDIHFKEVAELALEG